MEKLQFQYAVFKQLAQCKGKGNSTDMLVLELWKGGEVRAFRHSIAKCTCRAIIYIAVSLLAHDMCNRCIYHLSINVTACDQTFKARLGNEASKSSLTTVSNFHKLYTIYTVG